MKQIVRKVFEIIFVIFVIALSVFIFINKDKLQELGNIGYGGVFLLCFLSNATVLLPAPSLLIVISSSLILNAYIVALLGALGSTLGEFVGYFFGNVSKDLSNKFQLVITKLTDKIKNPVLLVFILAILPLPFFDVVGIYSGGTKLNPFKFFIACFLGKFVKMILYIKLASFINLPNI